MLHIYIFIIFMVMTGFHDSVFAQDSLNVPAKEVIVERTLDHLEVRRSGANRELPGKDNDADQGQSQSAGLNPGPLLKTAQDEELKTEGMMEIDVPWQQDQDDQPAQELPPELKTEVFHLQYTLIHNIREQIDALLTEDTGEVEYDPRSQKIVVTDTAEKLDQIGQLIEKMDRKVEVFFETQVVQVQLNEEQAQGVDWEAIVSHYQNIDAPGSEQSDQRRHRSVGVITDEDFTVLLEALETVGEIKMLSSPNITTINENEIYLNLKSIDTNVIMTLATHPTQQEPPVLNESVDEIDQRFFITPIIQDEFLQALWENKKKYSQNSLMVTLIPLQEKRQNPVTLDLKNNEMIVIGGIFRDQNVESTRKIPLLGDLPILGFAFRNQNTLLVRTEHIIFLIPKIIVTPAGTETL